MMNVSDIKNQDDLVNFDAAVRFAIDCANNSTPSGQANACGRFYVNLGKFRSNGKAAAIMKERNLKLFDRPYQVTKSIYVGYDNADGHAMAHAIAMARGFRECGFNAWADADMD